MHTLKTVGASRRVEFVHLLRNSLAICMAFAALHFSGCGSKDPTEQFKSFIKQSTASFSSDANLKKYNIVESSYDVTKTDSTISPYTAILKVSVTNSELNGKYIPLATAKLDELEKLFGNNEDAIKLTMKSFNMENDNGIYTCGFSYAFQDGKWVLKESVRGDEYFPSWLPEDLVKGFTPK